MKPGQTKQFDTFDTMEDRKELVILFQKMGEGLPEPEAMKVRAKFLEGLIPLSLSSMAATPLKVSPQACNPLGAYFLFIAIVGVLGVPIADAARKVDAAVKAKNWVTHDRCTVILGS